MNKSIILVVVLMFALALGAGVVAGKLSSRGTAPTIETGTLSEELKLTADQQKQMQRIWGANAKRLPGNAWRTHGRFRSIRTELWRRC